MDFPQEQCYFCTETKNLIHMDTNSLIINQVYIDFGQLLMDLMQIKIDDEGNNLVCVNCKDQLSQFYVMKQKGRKHAKPSDIRKIQIIEMVMAFLDSLETDCIVSKFSKLLAIHLDSNNIDLNQQLNICNDLIDSEVCEDLQEAEMMELNVVNLKDNEDAIVSYEFAEDDSTIIKDEPLDFITLTNYQDDYEPKATPLVNEILPKHKISQKIRPKKYQKSNFQSKEQRQWMRNELKQGSYLIQTPMGYKTQWSCNRCDHEHFKSESMFRQHLKLHLNESALESSDVKIENMSRKVIDVHSSYDQKLWIQEQLQSQQTDIVTENGIEQGWHCSLCKYVTDLRGRFRIHLQKTHTTLIVRFPNKHSCHSCHLRFDGENHLQVHKNCHRIFDVITPHVQFPECESCKMFFCTNDDFEIHLSRHREAPESLREPIIANGVVHRNGETFITEIDDMPEIIDENAPTCGHCLQKFLTENECKNHLLIFHSLAFICPFDGRVFEGIPTLSFGNHLRQCHPDIFPDLEIACSFCKMQFDTVYEKLAHTKICKEKRYLCDHCDRSFFRKSEILHHLKVATGLVVFACHFCGKRCKDQGDLKTHIRSHTNIRPYPCPHCDKAYKTSSARASHVESHMEQNHVCNICNVKFRRRILYQRHMKFLHDESYRQKCFAENTCKVCNKSYLRKTHFKNHMKTHVR